MLNPPCLVRGDREFATATHCALVMFVYMFLWPDMKVVLEEASLGQYHSLFVKQEVT